MRLTLFLTAFVASSAFALPPAATEPGEHYILVPQHPLRADEVAALRAKGLIVGAALGSNRFMVRVSNPAAVADDLRIRSLDRYDWTRKIARSAWAEAASATPFGRVRVIFHDEVGFEDARQAIEEAGGELDSPLATDWQLPNTLVARLPGGAVQNLARDERVFGIYGPPLRVKTNNVVAAGLSHVTPLFTAPYNLSGSGVVLSLFELAKADGTHLQFQGRYDTSHGRTCVGESGCDTNTLHATHVAGTMISAGLTDPSDT